MKFTFGYIIIILQLLTFQSLHSQWQSVNTGFNANYYDISVVDNNTIWSAGTKIVRTTNGGLNWIDANLNNPELNVLKISAANNEKAWVVRDSFLYSTTNGGQSWSAQNYSPKKYINNIHFFNQNTGILLADPVNDTVGFFITRNGGVNWYRSQNAPPNSQWLNDNCLSVFDTSLICFQDYTNNQGHKFYKLSGGLDGVWQIYSLPFSFSYPALVVFKDLNNGLMTDGIKLAKTTNGGINWIVISDSLPGVPAVHFITVKNTQWLFVNNSHQIKISYNWGVSWQGLVTSQNLFFGNLDAYDTNSIWMAGGSGINYKYNFDYIGILKETKIVKDFRLHQNYPNPFNPQTIITFDIPITSVVTISIYDNLGRLIEVPLNQVKLNAGKYEYKWNAENLPSGVYFCKLNAGNYTNTIKMILLK